MVVLGDSSVLVDGFSYVWASFQEDSGGELAGRSLMHVYCCVGEYLDAWAAK